jgi:hypothetical protein
LSPSNNTFIKGAPSFSKSVSGRNFHFGIREHAMAAAMNGMALSNMLIPYGGTFLIFSDYMKGAMRLTALMKIQVIYILTHDSIGLGEDGPTHQPIEQLTHLRAIPNMSVIRPGDVQRMSAGTGVTHSEFNGSRTDRVHFLQIWIVPEKQGLAPGYEQKHFSIADKQGNLRLIASRNGQDGSVTIHQDTRVFAAVLDAGQTVTFALETGRHVWVHVVRGDVNVAGHALGAGDATAIRRETEIVLSGLGNTEVLLFDLV